jgi:large subunit ribosomal protein L9
MQNQLLLLEDVYNLGRKGDIVKAKPGFVRNYLVPQKKAVIASKQSLRLREKLQQERFKQATEDKIDSEKLAKFIEGKVLETSVKVDKTGHLYGSVSIIDIVELLNNEGLELDKNNIQLAQPLKKLGQHRVELKLKEGVPAYIFINVKGEGMKDVPVSLEVEKSRDIEVNKQTEETNS